MNGVEPVSRISASDILPEIERFVNENFEIFSFSENEAISAKLGFHFAPNADIIQR